MNITNRQYAHLAYLFEQPTKHYLSTYCFDGNLHRVERKLIDKGLVKQVEFSHHDYLWYQERVKEGELTQSEFDEYMEYEAFFKNTDKVWAYRQWMTHEKYAEINLKCWKFYKRPVGALGHGFCSLDLGCSNHSCSHPLPLSYDTRNSEPFAGFNKVRNQTNHCEYTSLTEEGVVAVIRKFGVKADSKLKVSAQPKWRVEWVETTV